MGLGLIQVMTWYQHLVAPIKLTPVIQNLTSPVAQNLTSPVIENLCDWPLHIPLRPHTHTHTQDF